MLIFSAPASSFCLMIPKSFEYVDPQSLNEAFLLLEKYGSEAKILSGGQSLVSLMKLRLANPKYIVDLSKVHGLSYIHRRIDGSYAIGAKTTHHEVSNSGIIMENFAALSEAEKSIGDFQIRNMGTIGGAICHADPAGNIPPTMVALDARFVLQRSAGQRIIPAKEFFLDTFTTEIRPDEILTEIILPQPPQSSGSAYLEFNRRHGDFAIVNVACRLGLDFTGKCNFSSIALGGVSTVPVVLREASDFLLGRELSENTVDQAIEIMSFHMADPPNDIHSTAKHRRIVSKVLVKRAIDIANKRIRGF